MHDIRRIFASWFKWPLTGSRAPDCPRSCKPSCPHAWEEDDGKCFFWSVTSMSWEDGEKSCQKIRGTTNINLKTCVHVWAEGDRKCSTLGGHLASVTGQRTQDYLVARNNTVWIGGTCMSLYLLKNINFSLILLNEGSPQKIIIFLESFPKSVNPPRGFCEIWEHQRRFSGWFGGVWTCFGN